MTEERLNEIKADAESSDAGYGASHVRELIEEVERLRAEVERLNVALRATRGECSYCGGVSAHDLDCKNA